VRSIEPGAAAVEISLSFARAFLVVDRFRGFRPLRLAEEAAEVGLDVFDFVAPGMIALLARDGPVRSQGLIVTVDKSAQKSLRSRELPAGFR
jgi:hypothetical protein